MDFTIVINKILEAAFEIKEKNPEKTIDELIQDILPIIQSSTSSKKTINDDERCNSRTFYENKHLDSNGLLLPMPDRSEINKYGDRCKCRKKGGTLFCTRHNGNQPLGIWNGEYAGKLLDYVKKTTEPIKTNTKPPKPVIKPKKKTIDQPKERMVRPPETKISLEEYNLHNDSADDSVDAYPINIDGVQYNIDDCNNVWTDSGELIGVYDKTNNNWISMYN